MWQFMLGLLIGDVIGFIICAICSADNKKYRNDKLSDAENGEYDVCK